MANLNDYNCMGNLGKDAEFTQTQGGLFLCKFSVAVKQRRSEEALWINVTAFNKLAEVMAQLFDGGALRKGANVYVSGALEMDKYQKADGTQASSLGVSANEIQLLDSRASHQPHEQAPPAQYAPQAQPMAPAQYAPAPPQAPQPPYGYNTYGQS